MKIVIFGLTVSSSWGNGHATIWRGLCKALSRRGHRVIFYEKDVPYYSATRDLFALPDGCSLRLYEDFDAIAAEARMELNGADLGLVTSYCPDGSRASELVLESNAAIRGFYDLDTPITLQHIHEGETVDYLPLEGLQGFDLVLSYTGGRALSELSELLGAKRAAPLYGSVDPEAHFPVPAVEEYRADLSYLGTYAADRQAALEALLVEPARNLPECRFIIGGAQYPNSFPWTSNIFFVRHMTPQQHPAFFSSCRATLNITRKAMASYGYCPSGRLFEAAACGSPILSDSWEGLERFLTPGQDLLVVSNAHEVVDALGCTNEYLASIARSARERTMDEHTAGHRVRELEAICESLPDFSSRIELAS